MPLKKEHELKIKKNFKDLKNDLKTDKILDDLMSADVLDINDYEKINSEKTSSDKNGQLLVILMKGPPKGYDEFLKCLRDDEHYVYLADQIENTPVEVENTKETIESWVGDRMPSEKQSQYLTDLHLLHFSKCINPAHLNLVGTCFDFHQVDVQNIEYKNNKAPEAACHDLVIKWRNKHGHKATVGRLIEKFFTAHQNTPGSVHDEMIWDALSKI